MKSTDQDNVCPIGFFFNLMFSETNEKKKVDFV